MTARDRMLARAAALRDDVRESARAAQAEPGRARLLLNGARSALLGEFEGRPFWPWLVACDRQLAAEIQQVARGARALLPGEPAGSDQHSRE